MLKSGEAGSTLVAAVESAALAGILPQSYDNVKSTNDKELRKYIDFVHAVLEGSEKARGKKEGGLRDSRSYLCTPIITGEIRPEEASTTARILNLTWTEVDLDMLSSVQTNVNAMPVIGYHWLRFLATVDQMDDFKEIRSEKMKEFNAKKYVNPGRLH